MRSSQVKSLAILVLMTASAAAGTLESDLAAMRKTNAWPVRETFLGWTADHHAVFRTLVCDPDMGGGRGPYCDLKICVAEAGAEISSCTEINEIDLNKGEEERKRFTNAVVIEEARRQLAALGPLVPGKPLGTSTIRPLVAGGQFTVARKGKAAGGAPVVVRTYLTPEQADEKAERPTNIDKVKVTTVSRSKDGTCVVAIGHYWYESHYEALATSMPTTFGTVFCDTKP